MTPRIIIRARREAIFGNTVSLFLAQKSGDTIGVATTLTFRKLEEHERYIPHDPLVTLENDEAQSLMDELWHLGIRPTEGHGSTGQIAAVEAHRDDLRAMLDKTLATVCNVVNASLLPKTGLSQPNPQAQ